MPEHRPQHLDLDKDRGLTITWPDGRTVFYPVGYLRAMSPSAEMREQRRESQTNPLNVLQDNTADYSSVTALDAELVGNYAIRIRFSDGHHTGIYSWDYLREIEPGADES